MESNINESLVLKSAAQNAVTGTYKQLQPEVSRYSVIKSNRHQLNTILNEYQNIKGNSDRKNYENSQMNERVQTRNQLLHKSTSSFDLIHRARRDKYSLLNGWSIFRKMIGMENNDHFQKAVSPNRDRLHNITDIDGTSSFNRQLSTNQPMKINYNKNETFQNTKSTFAKWRLNGRNFDSKRNIRVDDIEGAAPKDLKSITQSKRIKMSSTNMKELLSQVDQFRKKILSK